MDLIKMLDQIESRDDLIQFIDQLRADLQHNPDEWENSDLDSYLEAMSAWLRDMNGYYKNWDKVIPASPSWRTVGEILLASRIYE